MEPAPFARSRCCNSHEDAVPGNFNGTQRFFFGSTPFVSTRATNARAISVWRTGSPATDRIAICGETYDRSLMGSQAPAGWLFADAANPTGFIAVYDGNGDVQWTHHFFDATNVTLTEDCAITDVSIRVDDEGRDVVTYCGISTHGSAAGGELAPLEEFTAAAGCNGGAPAGLPTFQWDGFVGRVVGTGPGTSARVFHSVVSGGAGQDGLFGIAEIDEDRFAVVGSTEDMVGASAFPFPPLCGAVPSGVVGVVLVFDASGVGPGGSLVLESGAPLGTFAIGTNTVARDVIVARSVATPTLGVMDLLYVVGSTDDAAFSTGGLGFFLTPAPLTGDTLLGATDGFVAAMAIDAVSPALWPLTFTYHGGAGDDGLTGVSAWSEFSEHFTVTGFTGDGAGGTDIDVGKYFYNNSFNSPPLPVAFSGPLQGTGELLLLLRTQFGGPTADRPAAMGLANASAVGFGFNQFGLGSEAGGGVAVGNDGRANVVGATVVPGGGYPVVGATARGPDPLSPAGYTDAVRTEVDMVLPGLGAVGIARTDGTGFQGGGAGTFPPAVGTGFTGGTTPFCALAEFGVQIGMPAPGLPRMLIDFEGTPAAGSTGGAILVSRPTVQTGAASVGVLQLGFPPAAPFSFITGAEFWLGGAMPVTYASFGQNEVFRLGFPIPLTAAGLVSAQLICLLPNPVVGPAAGCGSIWTASPALWFNL